jgi:hypothetical protein
VQRYGRHRLVVDQRQDRLAHELRLFVELSEHMQGSFIAGPCHAQDDGPRIHMHALSGALMLGLPPQVCNMLGGYQRIQIAGHFESSDLLCMTR